jgi:N-acyl homoserine lactone hydrolase
MTSGDLTGKLGMLMEGGDGDIKVPVPAYLIEHAKGSLLFDTGHASRFKYSAGWRKQP